MCCNARFLALSSVSHHAFLAEQATFNEYYMNHFCVRVNPPNLRSGSKSDIDLKRAHAPP